MNPYIVASLISTVGAVACVVLTAVLQNRRIDRDNRAALADQTSELKAHACPRCGFVAREEA